MSDANRSFQKGDALTGRVYILLTGRYQALFDIEAACVHVWSRAVSY
jgi:hypothetical protein